MGDEEKDERQAVRDGSIMLLSLALTVPIVVWVLALLRRYVIEADWVMIPTAVSMLPLALIVWAVLCEALRRIDAAREGDPPK